MHFRLAGPSAERWAEWFAERGHETTVSLAATDVVAGQLVIITGGDVLACAAAAGKGADASASEEAPFIAAVDLGG